MTEPEAPIPRLAPTSARARMASLALILTLLALAAALLATDDTALFVPTLLGLPFPTRAFFALAPALAAALCLVRHRLQVPAARKRPLALAALVVIAVAWWRSMPAHDWRLTLAIAAALVLALLTASRPRRRWTRVATALAALALLLLTWLRTDPGLDADRIAHLPAWARLARADLSSARLRNAALSVARLEAASLRGADLRHAALDGARLQRADLTEAELQGANLVGARLEAATLRGAGLEAATLWGARLDRADLRGARLTDANLRGAWLEAADLRAADLRRAAFRGAHLAGADLRGAGLDGTILFAADLQSARWSGVSGAAALHGADLRGARDLTQGDLAHSIGDADTLLPAADAPDTGAPYFVWTCWDRPPAGVDRIAAAAAAVLSLDTDPQAVLDDFLCRSPRRPGGTPLALAAPYPEGHPLADRD